MRSELNKKDEKIEELLNYNEYYGTYQWFDDFSKIINSNPIDKDYEKEDLKLQES